MNAILDLGHSTTLTSAASIATTYKLERKHKIAASFDMVNDSEVLCDFVIYNSPAGRPIPRCQVTKLSMQSIE